jgi:hypothetical protein
VIQAWLIFLFHEWFEFLVDLSMVNHFFHSSFFTHVWFLNSSWNQYVFILFIFMFRILSLFWNIIVDIVIYVLSMVVSHQMNVVIVHIHVMNIVMYFLYLMSMTSWGSFSLCLIKFFSIGFNVVLTPFFSHHDHSHISTINVLGYEVQHLHHIVNVFF